VSRLAPPRSARAGRARGCVVPERTLCVRSEMGRIGLAPALVRGGGREKNNDGVLPVEGGLLACAHGPRVLGRERVFEFARARAQPGDDVLGTLTFVFVASACAARSTSCVSASAAAAAACARPSAAAPSNMATSSARRTTRSCAPSRCARVAQSRRSTSR
jgi:hypothetical protein